MAFEIRKMPMQSFPKQKPAKSKDYLSFLHKLPCVVTGASTVQAAHVSFAAPRYGHYGRGKGTKAPDRWALPLSPDEHAKQHSMSEARYWGHVDINPHLLALTIWGLFTDMGYDAEPFAIAVINQYRQEAGR
jgi:hypothetical protein